MPSALALIVTEVLEPTLGCAIGALARLASKTEACTALAIPPLAIALPGIAILAALLTTKLASKLAPPGKAPHLPPALLMGTVLAATKLRRVLLLVLRGRVPSLATLLVLAARPEIGLATVAATVTAAVALVRTFVRMALIHVMFLSLLNR